MALKVPFVVVPMFNRVVRRMGVGIAYVRLLTHASMDVRMLASALSLQQSLFGKKNVGSELHRSPILSEPGEGQQVSVFWASDCLPLLFPFLLGCPARPDGGPAAQEFWAGSRRRLKARQGQPLLQQHQNQQEQHGSSSHPPFTASRSSRPGQVTLPLLYRLSRD